MEPLAPGTEDEPLYTQAVKPSKKETAEEQALSKKAFLPDGSYGTIFELNYVQGAQHWYCKVCECPVLGRLFNHEIGKRHTANLEHWNKHVSISDINRTLQMDINSTDVPIVVAPGEPVPPGFEEEVEKITLIQERLDGFNVGPLVGLEYLLELLDYDPSKEPSYLCILCDKKGDPRTVLTHLSSYNHQIMYLQKHFPTAYRHIAPYMIKQFKRNWQAGLQKIAEAIETTFGRLKPMPVEAGKFEKDRMYYIEIVAKGKHFSELSGHTFDNVVTKEELIKVHEETKPYDSNLPFRTKAQQGLPKRKSPSPPVVARPIKRQKDVTVKKKRSLSPVSDISSSDLEDFDVKKPVKHKEKEKSPKKREGPMPWQKSNYGRSKTQSSSGYSDRKKDDKHEKMEEFKKLSKAIDNDMDQVFKKHKQNPEKHQKYNDEWKKFWNARYKELQSEGKNAATHDFKPEWIDFWNKRMLELHQEELKSKKVALRRRLGLPEEPAPISFKIGERRKPGDKNRPVPTAAQPDNDPEVIVIDDNDRDSFRSSSESRRKSRSPPRRRDRSPQYRKRKDSPASRKRDRSLTRRVKTSLSPRRHSMERISPEPLKLSPIRKSRSPDRFNERSRSRDKWEMKSDRYRDYEDKMWERSYRNRAPWESHWDPRYSSMDAYAPPKIMRDVTRKPVLDHTTADIDDDEEVNIVAVLRLLTALEDKLGSLGPKVIDLLAQALALEKKNANSSEELLDSEINCVLFETVKEKLKGQLLVGFVDHIQEKAFKKAIKKTASLIHTAGERKKQREVELPKKPVVVPGIGTVDKGKIARQIANALIAQGKTDVTQDELEQLINAVVGMAEAKKNSTQQITTASFLEKLASGSVNFEEKPKTTPTSTETNVIVEESIKEVKNEDTNSQDKIMINMEGLSDADLQTLLQNFKDLSTDEQHGLINYLKKLEDKEPERVEKLRKFVDLSETLDDKKDGGRYSPFSIRIGSINPASKCEAELENETKDNDKDNQQSSLVEIDSDEEDYSFDDVAKAAQQTVFENEIEKKRIQEEIKKEDDDKKLNDAKALISSLMSSLNKTTTTVQAEAKENSTGKINIISDVPVNSTDLVNNLSGITMSISSLGSILGNVQNLTKQNQLQQESNTVSREEPKLRFSPNTNVEKSTNPRNPYNEFNITSQKEIRSNRDFDSNEDNDNNKNRQSRSYDEFNIGPNPSDLRDEMMNPPRDSSNNMNLGTRGMGNSGFLNKPSGYQERGRISPFSSQPSMSVRGNISSLFSNQFRSGSNNSFDNRGGGGSNDYGPDRRDFRGPPSDVRGPSSDVGRGPSDFRNDFRSTTTDTRSNSSSFRGGILGDFRGGSDFRDIRESSNNFRANDDFPRNNQRDLRIPPSNIGNNTSNNDSNRLGNNQAPPRYQNNFSGNSNNFNTPFRRW